MAVTLRSNFPSRGPSASQMGSGEIYSENTDTGDRGFYVSPRAENDAMAILQSTGGLDYVNQQNYAQNANRFAQIQEQYGVPITGMENKLQFDEQKAAAFDKMTPADKLAVQMVMSGAMAPKDYYTIAKKAETDRETAAMKMLQGLDLNKAPVDLMKDGEGVPMSAGSLSDLMNPAGQTSAEIGKPYPTMVYNVGQGKDGGEKTPYEQRTELSYVRGLRKDFTSDTFVKAIPVVDRYFSNTEQLFNDYKNLKAEGKGKEANSKLQTLDQSILYGFNKDLDDISAVMPGEFARTLLGSSIPQKVINKWTSGTLGGFELSDQQRQDFINAMKTFRDGSVKRAVPTYQQYIEEAKQAGIEPGRIVGGYANYFPGVDLSSAGQTPAAGQAPAANTGNTFASIDEANAAAAAGQIKAGDKVVIGGRTGTWR